MRRLRRWLWQPVVSAGEFIHRGRHGWAPRDCWELDGYLARVMGESLHHLAETEHGWPGWENQDFEDWVAELHMHADDLLIYAERHFVDDCDPRPTLRRLAEIWWHLWD